MAGTDSSYVKQIHVIIMLILNLSVCLYEWEVMGSQHTCVCNNSCIDDECDVIGIKEGASEESSLLVYNNNFMVMKY